MTHEGELPLEMMGNLPPSAFELARFWVDSNRSYVAVGYPEKWSPELLGSLLVESVHTAAVAYAQQTELPEQEALDAIWRGLDEERERLANGL